MYDTRFSVISVLYIEDSDKIQYKTRIKQNINLSFLGKTFRNINI